MNLLTACLPSAVTSAAYMRCPSFPGRCPGSSAITGTDASPCARRGSEPMTCIMEAVFRSSMRHSWECAITRQRRDSCVRNWFVDISRRKQVGRKPFLPPDSLTSWWARSSERHPMTVRGEGSSCPIVLIRIFARSILRTSFKGLRAVPDPSAQDIGVSRHAVGHGVASTSEFNRKSAVIGILIVHQLSYWILKDERRRQPELLPKQIEGILRTQHNSLGIENQPSPKNLSESAVTTKIENEKCLLLPHRFDTYLREVYFANFDPSAQDIGVSRHAVGHGVASTSEFNRKSAVIGILIVHQLSYFLKDERRRQPELLPKQTQLR